MIAKTKKERDEEEEDDDEEIGSLSNAEILMQLFKYSTMQEVNLSQMSRTDPASTVLLYFSIIYYDDLYEPCTLAVSYKRSEYWNVVLSHVCLPQGASNYTAVLSSPWFGG